MDHCARYICSNFLGGERVTSHRSILPETNVSEEGKSGLVWYAVAIFDRSGMSRVVPFVLFFYPVHSAGAESDFNSAPERENVLSDGTV